MASVKEEKEAIKEGNKKKKHIFTGLAISR